MKENRNVINSHVFMILMWCILIGEDISQHWKSTDGLIIYFGRNGIDLKNKEMVPLNQGNTSKHFVDILLTGK
jgi:hypothetical protein